MRLATNESGTKVFTVRQRYFEIPMYIANLDRTLMLFTFIRHDIHRDTTELFDSFDLFEPPCRYSETRNLVPCLYCIDDSTVVLVAYNEFCLTQHLIKFVPPRLSSGMVYNTKFHRRQCECPYYKDCSLRGDAITVCTRRKTLISVTKISIGLSLLSKGKIVIVGISQTDEKEKRRFTHLLCVAANPLKIERYPDEDLCSHISTFSTLASTTVPILRLAFVPPIFHQESIYFWFLAEGVPPDPQYSLETTVLGVLSKRNNDEYVAEMIKFDNSQIKNPDKTAAKYAIISNGKFSFVRYLRRDTGHYSPWNHVTNCAQKCELAVKEKLDDWFYKGNFSFVQDIGTVHRYGQVSTPYVYFAYSIDFHNKKFRNVPYEIRRADPGAFLAPTSNGDLLIISLPVRVFYGGYGLHPQKMTITIVEKAGLQGEKKTSESGHSQQEDKGGLGRRVLKAIQKPFNGHGEKM